MVFNTDAFFPLLRSVSQFHDDEDEDEDSVDEEAEDHYNSKALPFIIGTPAFVESDDAGLGMHLGGDEEGSEGEERRSSSHGVGGAHCKSERRLKTDGAATTL